jgi:hypothetical protein
MSQFVQIHPNLRLDFSTGNLQWGLASTGPANLALEAGGLKAEVDTYFGIGTGPTGATGPS